MNELVDYLERIHPGYEGGIRGYDGSSRPEEDRAGRATPEVYRRFLAAMGGEPGPILQGVSLVLPEERIASSEVLDAADPDGRFFYLLEDLSLQGEHWWLDLEAPDGNGDYAVVNFGFGVNSAAYASPTFVSFREALFMAAAKTIHLRHFANRATFTRPSPRPDAEPTPTLAEVESVLRRAGMTPLPQLSRCRVFERDGAVGVVYRYVEEDIFALTVSFEHPEELRRFHLLLTDHTAMVAT